MAAVFAVLSAPPLIVLTWEDAMRGAPSKYLSKCEAALFEFENGEPMPSAPCWWSDEDEEDETEDGEE